MSSNKFIIKIDPTELVPKTTARLFYYAAFWIIVAQIAVIAYLWNRIPTVVPLFFTAPWGEGRLAPKIFLGLLPLLTFISMIVNLILGRGAKGESHILSYTLAVATCVISIMFSLSLWGILQSLL